MSLPNTKVRKSLESREFKEVATPGCYLKARHSLLLLQFFGMISLMFLRNNISIAIVAMVNSTSYVNSTNQSNSCVDRGAGADEAQSNGPFNWNTAEQGLVLGSYFYGYVASSIPGGYVSRKYGMKYPVGLSGLIASVLTICTPFVANYSFVLLVVVRVLVGWFQGILAPAMVGLWNVWGPPLERSFLISFFLSGTCAGAFLNLLISGVIAEEWGWEVVFYVSGGGGVVWSVMWAFLTFETPDQHPRISEQEKTYIKQTTIQGKNTKEEIDSVKTPWRSMFTSLPLLAICIALFATNWSSLALASVLPTYMATVLNFNVAESGVLSALPDVLKWLVMILAGYLTSFAQRKTQLSIEILRKTNQTLSLVATSIFLVLAGYVGCNVAAAVAMFCLAYGFTAFATPGCFANSLDIAPRFAGILYGISNTIGNIPGFLAPQVIGFILLDDNSLGQWKIVFWISAGVSLLGASFFLLFASGEIQYWAEQSPATDVNANIPDKGIDNNSFEWEGVSTNL